MIRDLGVVFRMHYMITDLGVMEHAYPSFQGHVSQSHEEEGCTCTPKISAQSWLARILLTLEIDTHMHVGNSVTISQPNRWPASAIGPLDFKVRT